jgi:hypothetical protein
MEYELKLEEKEVNLVLTGLAQLAYINSAELIHKIKLACTKDKPKVEVKSK